MHLGVNPCGNVTYLANCDVLLFYPCLIGRFKTIVLFGALPKFCYKKVSYNLMVYFIEFWHFASKSIIGIMQKPFSSKDETFIEITAERTLFVCSLYFRI